MSINVLKRLEELKKMNLTGYELVMAEALEDLNSAGLVLRHQKSGARVVILSNDDRNKVFSIGFKTPPSNDTGLQHILEHSTLCGSRKYPVKDPFVELCKGSLNTFLNAMTYPDKTVYPVASCNDADFKNITDVYMDAVFYPDIYKHPEIFRQEGWHYELDSVDDELRYNGVVFNEMKGVYSSPDDVLSRYTFSGLFPDTQYRYESGGDPEVIPTLQYEDFIKYHREFYHPSNSYIYIYGDMDVEERLCYLDREYLSAFDKRDVSMNVNIQMQQGFDKPRYDTREYAITEEESTQKNTYLSYNVVVGTTLESKLYLAMQILDYALVMAPGAPLKQALVDAGIGTDIYSSFETSVYQPVYSIVAKNADESQRDLFVQTIQDVLSNILKDGINKRTIAAGINYLEFKYREADYGHYPKGLMYYLTMMDSWLYDDGKPFINIEAGETFEQIKKEADGRLFEDLIQKYLLENNHKLILSLVPRHGLEEEIEQREAKRLREYRDTLSKEQLQKIAEDTLALKQYQDEPSSQEDLEKIPMLKLSDIDQEPHQLYIDPREVAGVRVVCHNIFTNKIAYVMLTFNCRCVKDEWLPYIGLLSSVLGLMSTERFSYPELMNEININSGGILTEAAVYTDKKDFDKNTVLYEVKGKVLYEKMPFILDIMEEIIYHTQFHDYKRLKEIIARIKSRLESSMTDSGHMAAMLSSMSQFSESAHYSDLMRGYRFYQFIHNLDDEFDDKKEEIAGILDQISRLIFTKENMIVSLTADDEGFQIFSESFSRFVPKILDLHLETAVRKFEKVHVKMGYTSSSQVQYVARCGNFVRAGYSYTGALKVLKVIFSYDYLWLNVRVKGGAYGCMSGFAKNGDTYMVSYRDPNLEQTNAVYEGAADYIRNFNVSGRDMVKFIIGTIGDMDIPLTPSAEGLRSFSAYICNTDMEMLKRDRKEVLEANVESIRKLAPLIEAAMSQNYFCVVGNQKEIMDSREMFDEIKPLFITVSSEQNPAPSAQG